jgi:hypothetical protein
MTYKICQVIFSTNRLEYLSKTLQYQHHLNFQGCDVDKIFIDDFPKNRNNLLIKEMVSCFGYNEIYLHEKNQGLSVTWSEFWNLIKDRDYDYIWHQEDDVEILESVVITDLIELLQKDSQLSQVVLKRQPWYFNETESVALESDILFKNLRVEKSSAIFSPMASLYSISRVKFPYSQWYKKNYPDDNYHSINLNEGMIGKALLENNNLISAHIKNQYGKNIINHIGDYFVGQRVLANEPHYDQFSCFNPEIKYNSRNGQEYK